MGKEALTWLHAYLADVSVSFPPFDVECALYAPQILQILGFKHLAPVANHVGDKHRIITAVLRPICVDRAVIARAARFGAQPGTVCEPSARVRVTPDLAIADVARYVRAMRVPGIDLFARSGQTAVGVGDAALAALGAGFHDTRHIRWTGESMLRTLARYRQPAFPAQPPNSAARATPRADQACDRHLRSMLSTPSRWEQSGLSLPAWVGMSRSQRSNPWGS